MNKNEEDDFLRGEATTKVAKAPKEEVPKVEETQKVAKAPEPQKVEETAKDSKNIKENSPKVKDLRKRERREIKFENLPVSSRIAPPLRRKGEVAVYKLIQFDNAVDNRIMDGPKKIEPQPFELVPHYKFYDEGEEDLGKRNKVLRFVDGTETYTFDNKETGRPEVRVREKIGIPSFNNGTMLLEVEKDYLKFLWMELHPRLENGKYRDITKPAIFRRVEMEYRNPYLQIAKMNLERDADNYVSSMNHQQRVALAAALAVPVMGQPGDLELALRMLAKQNPERVLFTSTTGKEPVKLRIYEALQHDLIEYMPDLLQWRFTNETGSFHTVLVNKDPVDDLAAYLITDDGSEDRKELLSQLERQARR